MFKEPGEKVYAVGCLLMVGFALFVVIRGATTPHPNKIRTQELSHIKQCGIAALLYAVDYHDRLPVAERWMSCVLPYAKDDVSVFVNVLNEQSHMPSSPASPQTGKYGNIFLQDHSEKLQAGIPKPDETIMLFTSRLLSWNATSGLETAAPSFTAYGGTKRIYVCFTDSSALSIKFDDLAGYDSKTGERKARLSR
ncbi:MAG: hypothetical protein KF784_14190 [Fimbriimonadaceae bacterium]|nr:hypothetical protein [Fimbriimonadaceae bacterium]